MRRGTMERYDERAVFGARDAGQAVARQQHQHQQHQQQQPTPLTPPIRELMPRSAFLPSTAVHSINPLPPSSSSSSPASSARAGRASASAVAHALRPHTSPSPSHATLQSRRPARPHHPPPPRTRAHPPIPLPIPSLPCLPITDDKCHASRPMRARFRSSA